MQEARVLKTGLWGDRGFCFGVWKEGKTELEKDGGKAGKWEFITQRRYPLLAKVRTELWIADEDDGKGVVIASFPCGKPRWSPGFLEWLEQKITARAREMSFTVPFEPSKNQIEKKGYTYEDITIWDDTITALNMGCEVPAELKTFLGVKQKLGLFRLDDRYLREIYRNAPRKEDIGYQPVTGFQDAVRCLYEETSG